MQLFMRLLIYFFAIVIIIIGRRVSKSILHPIRLYTLFWTLLIIIAISWWNINYKWSGVGLLWIEASLFFTELGTLLISRGRVAISANNGITFDHIDIEERRYNWKVYYVILALSFLAVVLTLSVNGFHLSDIRSFNSILSISSEMTNRRYHAGEETSTIQKIVSIFGSVGVLCGGYAFSFTKNDDRFHRVMCFLSFTPIVLTVLLTTAKSGMIASAILFVAGWSISRLRIKGDFLSVDTKLLLKLGLILIGLLLFLYFAMLVRVGDFSEGMRKIINEKFFVYGFGEIVEFDGWFAGGEDFYRYQMGTNTYMVLPRMLGLVDRMQGVYNSYVYGYGNVFTAFRGIIADFGIFGGLVFCFLRGVVTQLCCIKVSRNPNVSYLAMTLIACQFFFGLYGFIISPWIYTTYVLGMFAFWLFMPLFDRRIYFGRKR